MGFDKLNLMKPQSSSERKVAGADCSGSKEVPNDTWLAIGTLSAAKLEVTHIHKVGMHALGKELNAIADLAVAGLDCPFSLPAEFLEFLAHHLDVPEFQNWQDVAEKIVFMPFEKFFDLTKEFKREPKRMTDKQSCAAAISPLHRGNPSMVQMTYHCMRVLASLDPKKFFVLPFQDEIEKGAAVIEVYPRATLKCLGLPDTGYKSRDKKEISKMQSARHKILHGLQSIHTQSAYKNCPALVLGNKVEHQVVDSDHALDALLACYAAALWLDNPKTCADPFEFGQAEVLLEGWIYEPSALAAVKA